MSEQEKPAYLAVTESGMKAALIEARGDIFVASQMLGVTALRLNRAIQVSATLQATVDTLAQNQKEVSTSSIDRAIAERLAIYRVAGLDSLYELAMMPIDENSAQNQVRLAAAARLAGSPEASGGGGDLAEALRDLNQLYQTNAPRLRVIRERLVVEVGSPDTPPLGDIVSTQQG